MNRSSSLLFYKLVSAAILAGVVASFTGLARVYRNDEGATAQSNQITATAPVTLPVAHTS